MIFFADLHIHIGRAGCGAPVKITASPALTVEGILKECSERKGIQIAGIVDCASPAVLADLRALVDRGDLTALPGGGLDYLGKVTLLLGAEIELGGPQGGSAHFLAFTPSLKTMEELSQFLSGAITNISLSSQRASLEIQEVNEFVVRELSGIFLPAHAFTPFKSVYGNCVRRLAEIGVDFTALELGLSSDTYLADRIHELSNVRFLSNSDAHSLPKIAREYNKLKLIKPDFAHFCKALAGDPENIILANYGLEPRLGKYHRTFCLKCERVVEGAPPVYQCSRCDSDKVVVGVLDRITAIADENEPVHPPNRPPYIHQVPLEFIPGVGKKTLNKLLEAFGTEMEILHGTSLGELEDVVGTKVAENIAAAREGRLALAEGGGGRYGRVKNHQEC
ncbi:MAG: TIGR00375 family protein [Firmicutes bacterium]|nr:TIGR00375 family protein [Bacillota bacterium]